MAIRNHNYLVLTASLGFSLLLSACTGPGRQESELTQTQQQVPLRKPEESEYQRLLAEAQQLSFTLDFSRLRKAFVESPEYSPYGGVKLAGLSEAYESVEQSEFAECLRHVDQVLASNYMSLEAHMIGVLCSGQSADFEREDRHRYMVEGLMDSIERSGDGRTQDTAYQTITTSELRGFVRLKGLQVLEQSIVYDDRGIYDKMRVRDPESGVEYPLFFDVSQQFVHGAQEDDQ